MRWYIGVVLILLAAWLLQSGLPAYAMYVLLAVLVLTRFLARVWMENLTARRVCKESTAEIGDRVEMTVVVRNEGTWTTLWVLLEDLLPKSALIVQHPRLRVKGKRIQMQSIRAGKEVELRYSVECLQRGYYQMGPLVMENGDLFGLHRRYRVAAEPHYLLVYPRVVPLEGWDIASRRPIGEVRLNHRLFEDPTRISGVREYQAGDPLNRVHWRATARTGALHSKIYEPSTLTGATLLLDFHRAGYHERGEPFRSELAVTATVSLAHAVYQLGQQIGLATNAVDAADRVRLHGWEGDHRTRDRAKQQGAVPETPERLQPIHVPTLRGAEQFQRIREALARAEITEKLTFAEMLLEVSPRLPRDATLLAVLPDVSVESAVALSVLRRQGYAVTVVLVQLDSKTLETSYGRLMAEGIRDVRRLKDEATLSMLCRQKVMYGPIPADGWHPFEDRDEAEIDPTGWANQRAIEWKSDGED